MNRLLIITGVMLLPFAVAAQTDGLENFKKKYAANSKVSSINISGAFFRMIMEIGKELDDDPELQALANLAGSIDNLAVLRVPFGKLGPSDDEIEALYNSLPKEGFEEMGSFRERNHQVKVYSRFNKKVVTDAVILVDENDQFAVMTINGNMTSKDISTLIRNIKHRH